MSGDFKSFPAGNVDLNALTHALTEWFRNQRFDGQILQLADGVQVQARQQEGWRKFTGSSAALQVTMRRYGDALNVEVGAGQWGDKAAAGAVGMFLLWPLAFTAAYGAYQQNKLPERVFSFIEQYIATGGTSAGLGFGLSPTGYNQAGGLAAASPNTPQPVSAPTPPPPPPPPLGAAAPVAASASAGTACKSCGTALPAGAAFCFSCGTKVA